MPIYIRCPYRDCKRLVPYERDTCKCGRKLPVTGRYYYLWFRRGGRRVKLSLGKCTVDYARRKEAELSTAAPSQKPLTWKEIRYAYLRKLELESRNQVYVENCRTRLKKFADHWGDDLTSSEITPQKIETFRLGLLEKKQSPTSEKRFTRTTVNRYIAAARAAWNYSIADDLPSPFRRVKSFRENNRITEYLTLKQRADLLDAAKNISQALWEIIIVALGTGLRKSEVLNLLRAGLDCEEHSLTALTKGGKIRTVALSPGVESVLAAIPDNGTPWFWVSYTGRPYTKDWRRLWFAAKAQAGIPKEFRFHGLRHDFGTRVLAATGNLRATQEALGHSEVRTTTRYAHVLPNYLREAVEAADPMTGAPKKEI